MSAQRIPGFGGGGRSRAMVRLPPRRRRGPRAVHRPWAADLSSASGKPHGCRAAPAAAAPPAPLAVHRHPCRPVAAPSLPPEHSRALRLGGEREPRGAPGAPGIDWWAPIMQPGSKALHRHLGALLCLLLFAASRSEAAMEQGTVAAVVDGDTIKVSLRGETETVRLIGVDTPEKDHPRREVECFGAEATRYTTQLLLGKTVALEADSQGADRDRYGRLLRYVWVMPDGKDASAEIIRNGFGLAYTAFPFDRLEEYRQLQRQARALSVGLWASACEQELEERRTAPTAVRRELTEEGRAALRELQERNDSGENRKEPQTAIPSGAGGSARGCCRHCESGKPCGDTCIATGEECHQPRGCAC